VEVRKSINLPGPHTYQINSYIRSNKILNIVILLVYVDKNIKYSYFIGLCRYKSRDTLRKLKTTVSKWRLLSQGKLRGRIRRKYRFDKADDRKVNNNKEKVHSIPHQQ
jgi:hypothetical protein